MARVVRADDGVDVKVLGQVTAKFLIGPARSEPPMAGLTLEVWPESHWPSFALRQADVFQSYAV